MVSSRVTPDGCSELIYEFNVENLGNVTISDIQVEDDLAAAGFDACTAGVTTTLTSDEFLVNPAYDGFGNNDLLLGTDNINPGDVGAILLTVEACGCPGGSPISNSATLTGTSPGGAPIEDNSDSGSDPDSDGMGEDGTDEMDPTLSTIGENPDFGVAKREVGVWLQDDGCFLVTYELNVENLGTTPILDLQVEDNLDAPPAGAGFNACDSYIIKELTSDDFIVNDGYDGNGDTELLLGTDILEIGDKGAILFTVEACGCPDGTAIANTATGSGMTPGGTTVEDMSSSGSDPDPSGDGETTDETSATETTLTEDADMGLAKREVSIELMPDGCTEVIYEFNLENLGNVTISDIQVQDDLVAAGFGSCGSFTTTLTSDEFLVNPAFDGIGVTNMLIGTDNINPNDVGSILLTISACNCPATTAISNSATATGTTPGGTPIDDVSDSGSDPDSDGMGEDGVDESDPTVSTIEHMAVMGLAKRLASMEPISDDCSRVTYEFNLENLGNTDITDIQIFDDINAAFSACGGPISIFQILSDDFTVNADYNNALTTGNLLTGQDDLPVGDLGSVILVVDACFCGTNIITNMASVTGQDTAGNLVTDDSVDGSDPDPNGDGDPDEGGGTTNPIGCTVAIICPDVHDPVNVQNDLEECGAIVNFPDAQIESNCPTIDVMDIQFMLTAVDGTLPVTDPANGGIEVPYDVWITGQAGGLMYPVDTITVTYRVNPVDLPAGPPPPVLNPGECSFDVIVRDEQCPVFVTTMPEDTLVLGNLCDIPNPFVINPEWHLRDNCDEPDEIAIDFEEIKFDSICPNTFTLKRTWLISDMAGNTCEHNHKIFVRDEAPPLLIVPPDTLIEECGLEQVIVCRDIFPPIDTIEQQIFIDSLWVITQVVVKDTVEVCDTLEMTVPLTAGVATATDGTCTAPEDIIITFRDSVELLCKGDKAAVVHRIWRAEDECGNADSLIQEITLLDPNPPVLIVPEEVTVSLDENGQVSLNSVLIMAEVFDACFTDINDIILDIQPSFFNCSQLGEHTVIVAATDPCNNRTAYEEIVVTIVDTQAPILNCPTGTVDININPMNCDASFAQILDIMQGADCDVSMTTSPDLGPGIDVTTTSITVTATDAAGNASSCVVSVNIMLTEDIDYSEILACNDRVNISLNGDCEYEIIPDNILEGNPEFCSDLLCVEVTDENGNDHLNFFDITDVGQVFNVRVEDCSGLGNSCWGQVRIEEKQIPEVAFPIDTTLLCVEPTSPDYFKLGYPQILNCESSIEIDYEDIYSEFGECSSPRATIERRWVVFDDEGNAVRDTQFINIIPFSTDHVRFPKDITLEDAVDCAKVTESFFDIENGLIEPTSVIHPDSTGLPDIFGLPLNNDAGLCLFSMGYTDEVLEICGGSFQILRRWTLNDVCGQSGSPLIHTQFITVYDVEGPEVEDVRLPISRSVDPWNCTFTGVLPLPDSLRQTCGDVFFEAYVTGEGSGFIQVEGSIARDDLNVVAVNVELGTHWVTYVYKDGCSNIELYKYQLTVIDEVAPNALCPSEILISLTSSGISDGTAVVYASSLDAGSQDSGCGEITSTCVLKAVDYEAGVVDIINGRAAYLAMNPCSIDGELLDTILDKTGEIEEVIAIPYVFCKDYVKICCDDFDQTDVVLIVEDAQGLSNHCTTTVFLQDKSVTNLNCQPHEIDCTEDKDVEVLSPLQDATHCGSDVSLSYSDNDAFVNSCGAGQIFRVWYIDTNQNGEFDEDESSCNQVITVTSSTAFDPYGIKWPKHYTGETLDGVNLECNSDDELIEQGALVSMGEVMECTSAVTLAPLWCASDCGLIGVSMEVDTVEAGDACLKLIKQWTVIDWCVWEANGSDIDDENDRDTDSFEAVEDWAQGVCDSCVEGISEDPVYLRYTDVDEDGYYTYDQVIVIIDSTPPGIIAENVQVDVIGGATSKDDPTACTSEGAIVAKATDFCGDQEFDGTSLVWTVVYDDGITTTESFFRGNELSIPTLDGAPGTTHSASLTVTDGCGNSSTETITIDFSDDKAPTPLCISGVTTAFMELDGTVAVWAKDFDLGSFDNCGAIDFSVVISGNAPISPDSTDFASQANIEFSCDDLTNLYELDVWVWDTSGNGDFCTVSVLIGGDCNNEEGGSGAIISGTIATELGDRIEGVTVTLGAQGLAEYPLSMVTEANGEFAFNNNPLGIDYQVNASKDYDYTNGVSTSDIVSIMNHILSTEFLSSGYNVIAADANNDGKISALDVVVLRKVILGLVDNFPNNESWRFVDKDFEMMDIYNPWPFVEDLNIFNMQGHTTGDLVGVKIGDVNGNAQANSLIKSEIRSLGLIELSVVDKQFDAGDEVTLDFTSYHVNDLRGLQLTLAHQGLRFVAVEAAAIELTEDHIGVHEDHLTMSYDGQGVSLNESEVLFKLIFEAESAGSISSTFSVNSSITKAEAYRGEALDQYDIGLSINQPESSEIVLHQNDPNPFATNTKIRFDLPQAAQATIIIYDVSGKELRRYAGQYTKGQHSILIGEEDLESSGLYYYQLKVDDKFVDSKKMVLIE